MPTIERVKIREVEDGEAKESFRSKEGCMWEGGGFDIAIDYQCSAYGGNPCRHCHSHKTLTHVRNDNSTYEEMVWICPKVIIASNEGGYNTTGVCADCVSEAISEIPSIL